MTNTTTPARKLVANKAGTTVSLREGRKNTWQVEVPAGLTLAAIEGILAGADLDTVTPEAIEAALAAALAKRGSVIPEDYRVKYGADQNCGDDVAAQLKKATTDAEGGLDMDAVERIAGQNDLGGKYDEWRTKGLNNGMVRMNLGNMLRAKARKGDEVRI